MAATEDCVLDAETKPKIPVIGYCALDIETSGRTRNDQILAIGMAMGQIGHTKIQTLKLVCRIDRPSEMTWQDFWRSQGWEDRCWNEFWSRNVPILEYLASIGTITTETELSVAFNAELAKMEAQVDKLILVTDTTLFDTPWLHCLLSKYDFLPLNYSRSNRYRGAYELNSFVEGSFHTSSSAWTLQKTKMEPLLPELGSINHNHDPEEDAKSILINYLRAVEYNRLQYEAIQKIDAGLKAIREHGGSPEAYQHLLETYYVPFLSHGL